MRRRPVSTIDLGRYQRLPISQPRPSFAQRRAVSTRTPKALAASFTGTSASSLVAARLLLQRASSLSLSKRDQIIERLALAPEASEERVIGRRFGHSAPASSAWPRELDSASRSAGAK